MREPQSAASGAATDALSPIPDSVLAMGPAEAAHALGVSRRHISRLIAGGAIQARRAGRRTLVDAASLRRFYEGLPETKHAPIVVGH